MNHRGPSSSVVLALVLPFLAAAPSWAQAPATPPAAEPVDAAVQAIQDKYEKGLLELATGRIQELDALAQKLPAEQRDEVLEILFQTAIQDNLYGAAEPAAERILALGTKAPRELWLLGGIVNLVAKVDRGAYQESLDTLRKTLANRPDAAADAEPLPVATAVSLIEVYLQRLIQKDQFAIANQAVQSIRGKAEQQELQQYLDERLARLQMIGQPAPPIVGKDLAGKPFNLADYKNKVVLVVFWASWCVPNAEQAHDVLSLYDAYHDKGFEIVGINLDTLQEGAAADLATAMPNIQRFLLDYNITWPNLVNGTGPQDFATPYKITDLPASVLVGRDGKIAHLDPSAAHLQELLEKLLEH